MMMNTYMLILVFSTAFGSWASERVFTRILREMGAPEALSQVMVVLSMLMFFIVVALPTGIIVGGFFVLALSAWVLGPLRTHAFQPKIIALLLIPVALGLYGLSELPGSWPEGLPSVLCWVAAGAAWLAIILPATQVQPHQWMFSIAAILSTVPLTFAPLLFPQVHPSIALDVAILGAALLGGMLTPFAAQPTTSILRLTVAFMVGGLMLQTLHYGAWPMATASAGCWFVSMALMRRRPVFEAEGVVHG